VLREYALGFAPCIPEADDADLAYGDPSAICAIHQRVDPCAALGEAEAEAGKRLVVIGDLSFLRWFESAD
jgi:hypothetical protein